MRILALEPYFGGSHQAFLDGWQGHSKHDWDLLTLPAYKWKWRMRHAPISFAEQIAARFAHGGELHWDVLFCSDMLNLAEFIGLAPKAIRDLPRCVMFHENQLTYPTQQSDQRDLHFAFSNITTALAADQVWFNSSFHQRDFLDAAKQLAGRMPDFQPTAAIDRIAAKSTVQPLGIQLAKPPIAKSDRVLDILWSARWEHDKDPATFFEAVRLLSPSNCPFRLHVVGESFRDVPSVFATAKEEFAAQIVHWGFVETRDAYFDVLAQSDVIVSTAQHEFFGLSILEAMSTGAVPLLPNRLSYPELLTTAATPNLWTCLYEGGAAAIAERLREYQSELGSPAWLARVEQSRKAAQRFAWDVVATDLDNQIDVLTEC